MNNGINLDMVNIRSKKGSFTLEYTVFIVLLLLALLAMRFYLKGAMQGKLRSAADAFGQGRQYESGVTCETKSW